MEQNRNNIDKVKEQIEETFANFIAKLKQQKEDLFTKLDEINKEKYFKFLNIFIPLSILV